MINKQTMINNDDVNKQTNNDDINKQTMIIIIQNSTIQDLKICCDYEL